MENLEDLLTLSTFPVPVLKIDSTLKVVDYSASAFEFLCLPDQKAAITGFEKLFPSGKRFNENDFSRHVRNRSELQNCEIYPHPFREDRWVQVRRSPLVDGFLVFMEDITREIQLYEMFRKSEATARIGTWEVNLEQNFVYWSSITKEIHEVPMDYEPGLAEGIDFYKPGISRDRIQEAVSRAIEHGEPFDELLTITTAKGKERWIRAIGHPEMKNGRCLGFFGLFQDMDNQVREKKRYLNLNNRYKMATEGAKIGIWDLDLKTHELIWNDTMFEVFDVDKEGFKGGFDDWKNTLHPDDLDEAVATVWDAVENHTPLDFRFRILTRKGQVRYIAAKGQTFYDERGQPDRMIGVNYDFTRQKKSDDRLRHLLNITEEQNKSLVNYAHIVSHNLRSNSSNLTMLAGMLEHAEDPEEQRRFLQMMNTSIQRLNDTILHLNEVIQIRSSDEDLQAVNLLETFHRCVGGLNALISEAKPELQIFIPQQFDVGGIPSYVESVFTNLMTNAIKYRREHELLKISVKAESDEDRVVVRFRDNGKGIDLKAHGDKIFGMYQTFHGNHDARGIGLFLTRNHMQSMQGGIEVESQVGQGTEFTLTFKRWEL